MPALLTRMSTLPKICFVSSKRRSISDFRAMLACTAVALPPCAVISLTTLSARVFLDFQPTPPDAPSPPTSFKIKPPFLFEPPFKTATFPLSFFEFDVIDFKLLHCWYFLVDEAHFR